MKYSVGQKVKIISMDKVRSYSREYAKNIYDCCWIGNHLWIKDMDIVAGTVQTIERVDAFDYNIKGNDCIFSPQMIEGPADPVKEEIDDIIFLSKEKEGLVYFIEDPISHYGKWRCIGDGYDSSVGIEGSEALCWTDNPNLALAWRTKNGAEQSVKFNAFPDVFEPVYKEDPVIPCTTAKPDLKDLNVIPISIKTLRNVTFKPATILPAC